MERATFSGSVQSMDWGLPVLTPQKPQERVQMLPRIIKVAVPSPQHSPILGQLPEVQMVFNWYLSTKPRSSVYFFPVGSLTRIHLGFGAGFSIGIWMVVMSVFIGVQKYKMKSRLGPVDFK